jgi:hypothetical protein
VAIGDRALPDRSGASYSPDFLRANRQLAPSDLDRSNPNPDPRFAWATIIYQARLDGSVVTPSGTIDAMYPKNLTAAVLEEQARILAQGVRVDTETAALSAQEHEIVEALEDRNHEDRPNWFLTYRSNREELLKRIIIIHLLGLAPAGYLTAPDNGP